MEANELFFLLINIKLISAILAEPHSKYLNQSETTFGETLRYCFASEDYFKSDIVRLGGNIMDCVNKGVISGLVNSVDKDCVDMGDGVTFVKDPRSSDDAEQRDILTLGLEPTNFRGILQGYSSFLSRRSLRWDLSYLYPGLIMKIGPTMTGQGVLEFAVERRLGYSDRASLRPGQVVIRKTVLPHLLGFRMNLITLVPIILGVIIYVSKNAVFFSKLALVVSSLLALKSLFLIHSMNQNNHHNDFSHDPVDTPGNILGIRPQPHSLFTSSDVLQVLSANVPPFKGVNDNHKLKDGSRNFVWEKRDE